MSVPGCQLYMPHISFPPALMSRNFPPLRPIEASLVASNLCSRPDTAAVRTRLTSTLNGGANAPAETDRFPALRPLEAGLTSANGGGAIDAATVHDAVIATVDDPGQQAGPDVPTLLATITERVEVWRLACSNGPRSGVNLEAQQAHMAISAAAGDALAAGVPEETVRETVAEHMGPQAWILIGTPAHHIATRLRAERLSA